MHAATVPATDPSDAGIRTSEMISALTYALDLTEGQPAGHCLRACWIGMHIGRTLGLSARSLSDLYYTLLLKDVGCSSNAARLCELYAADDLVVKREFKRVDTDSLAELGRFVLGHAGLGRTLRERFSRVLDLIRRGETLATELVATRCERGSQIARELGFSDTVADGVRCLDEHWNGRGRPRGMVGDAIPIESRIALLAQVADVFHAVDGPAAASSEIRRRASSWFDPAVVAAFDLASEVPGFWSGLENDEGLRARVVALEPDAQIIHLDEDGLDRISEAFARVVDAKSPYTYGHSERVATYADALAGELGIAPERRRWLRRAALLHDIGKMGVSNAILDKPARLDEDEWTHVRMHAAYSEEILSRIDIFAELAKIAGAHHERLDGQGYPHGLSAAEISLETRIITTADIFDAITAERPYRGAIPVPQALMMMEKERGAALDPRCLDALARCMDRLVGDTAADAATAVDAVS